MFRHASFGILSTILVAAISVGFMLAPFGTPVSGAAPTAPPIATPKQSDKPNATPQPPQISFDSNKIGKPVTINDLLAKYPSLKPFVDQIEKLDSDDVYTKLDFAQLYKAVSMIYKDYGSPGVIVFLQETYLSDDLGIPDQYYELLMFFDQGGFDKIQAQAKTWKLTNDKEELVAWVVIYPEEKLAEVKTALQKLGISLYAYDDDEGSLDVGIPFRILRDLKTPDAVLKFWSSIYQIEGVDEFGVDATGLIAVKSK